MLTYNTKTFMAFTASDLSAAMRLVKSTQQPVNIDKYRPLYRYTQRIMNLNDIAIAADKTDILKANKPINDQFASLHLLKNAITATSVSCGSAGPRCCSTPILGKSVANTQAYLSALTVATRLGTSLAFNSQLPNQINHLSTGDFH